MVGVYLRRSPIALPASITRSCIYLSATTSGFGAFTLHIRCDILSTGKRSNDFTTRVQEHQTLLFRVICRTYILPDEATSIVGKIIFS